MIDRSQLEALYDCDVIDKKGERIGSVKQVWLDDEDGAPAWAEVHTGLFGLRESFVPIQQARVSAGAITVPVDKELVKEAPKIDVDGQKMSDDQQQELYRHYGMIPSAKRGEHDRLDQGRRDERRTDLRDDRRDDDLSVTRSEEQLEVGTRQVEAGRVRLVKHVVTEQRDVTVPVSHEEVRVVREPVDGPARNAFAEEEASVTLHREEPVVQKRAEAVERVRLEKDNVTEQQRVTGEVRKERVDVERDDQSGR
ncbi:DUF2382 domain-containing protein [Nocardia sp. NRRL S-836]|uniref:DUF2382 domain-containing protein n=1 Tax=Nocardia sp. NRRL S-836 TaxID=1519492 RepID=UPI0006AF2213|nr:PRC and DUF2382 domain-containing protein [Nocardia sp. NRRL S-836]KOV83274.1 hypothetical protein ADL03_20845 [Nocardia sp. NRRL S-836]